MQTQCLQNRHNLNLPLLPDRIRLMVIPPDRLALEVPDFQPAETFGDFVRSDCSSASS